MMTVDGLFDAGGAVLEFSSGSFTKGRIAAKAAVKYVNDLKIAQPQVSEKDAQPRTHDLPAAGELLPRRA